MNAIRDWASVICICILAVTAIQYLSPNGAMERAMQIVTGAFLICSILLPLSKALPQLAMEIPAFSSQIEPNTQLEDTVDRQLYEAAQSGITAVVTREIGKMGLSCKNVEINMDINESGSIVINQVKVFLAQVTKEQCVQAQMELQNITGLNMEVVMDGG